MAGSKTAPAQHSQPSRKNKKAWRKNVDLTELQQGLENARDEEILTGGKTLSELPANDLFQTDTSGSIAIRRETEKEHGKLKSEEILALRSAIPAVSLKKRRGDPHEEARKRPKISHRELQRLKQIAFGGQAHRNEVEATGDASHDPWLTEEKVPNPAFSHLEEAQPKKAPVTLRHAPVTALKDNKRIANVRRPAAGKSYNPEFEAWQDLLEKKGSAEVEAEKRRLAQKADEEDRLERVAKAADEADREAEKADLSEYESEWEGIQSEYEESHLRKKRPERKTPADRNKVKRRKQAEALARHEARMSDKEKQIKQLIASKQGAAKQTDQTSTSLQKFAGSVESSDADDDDGDDEEAHLKRRYPFGKRIVPKAQTEVVLADELEESLRRLKPEGNLLLDRYRTAVLQGKVEARKAAPKQKKRNVKPTEKWSYKDWELPRKTV